MCDTIEKEHGSMEHICPYCPLGKYLEEIDRNRPCWVFREEHIDIVQKWSDEHTEEVKDGLQ